MKYILQRNPFQVPTNDGKIIKEHFGIPSTGMDEISIAHMIAPAGWNEPFQVPEFDECTFVIRGRKMIEIDDEKIIINAGESILIRKGTKVRYSNPFNESVKYISICIPAFSIERVHRENE